MQNGIWTILILVSMSAIAIAEDQLTNEPDEVASLHWQATTVTQVHPAFSVPYSGVNSLSPKSEVDTSFTSTLYIGASLWSGMQLHVNPEAQAGRGFSSTMGIAQFPNGEIYRVDSLDLKVNLARAYISQTINLSDPTVAYVAPDNNQLGTHVGRQRLVFTAGKIALNDIFDNNAYAHDPRTQFLNWAFMDFAAWDYAADTRGYTEALVTEYYCKDFAIRGGLAAVATTANGEGMELTQNGYSLNFEVEQGYSVFGKKGKIRLLTFLNKADMGSYATATSTNPAAPNVNSVGTPSYKYGAGIGLEQVISRNVGFFSRISANDGQTQSWMFTEADESASAGFVFDGDIWQRAADKFGIAFSISGISPQHAAYLAAGGYGFMVGDGALNYTGEKVLESYYSWGIAEHFAMTLDYQLIGDPGYNADRVGPVNAIGLRLHLDF